MYSYSNKETEVITVSTKTAAEADRKAAEAVVAAQEKAREEGRDPDDPQMLFLLHRAAWSSVTGAEVVRIVD